MLIWEFRIVMPMTVEEYQVAQLYSVAQASKNETGGGEGIEVKDNSPFSADIQPDGKPLGVQPEKPLLDGEYTSGQFTHKIYHLQSRVPKFVRAVAPKGSLDIVEKAWNAYPFCRTIVNNPGYMKENFFISIETMHAPDKGTQENVHKLSPKELKDRVVVYIDIANDEVQAGDYKAEEDPTKYKSQKSGRGPLVGKNWKDEVTPVMCCYKLVKCEFKWMFLQNKVERFIQKSEKRIFLNFHRQVFCWMDEWFDLTMADIRALEDKTQKELDEARDKGEVRGTKGGEE